MDKATPGYLRGKNQEEATQKGRVKAYSRSKRKVGRRHKEVETTAELLERNIRYKGQGEVNSNGEGRLQQHKYCRTEGHSIK